MIYMGMNSLDEEEVAYQIFESVLQFLNKNKIDILEIATKDQIQDFYYFPKISKANVFSLSLERYVNNMRQNFDCN